MNMGNIYTSDHRTVSAELLDHPLALLPEHVGLWVRGEGWPVESALPSPKREAVSGGGVMVIPIMGTITKRPQWYGGTSVDQIRAQFRAALADRDTSTIVFDIDSPGGSTSGVEELATEILEARGKKRMISVANTLAASAAYWLGSSAGEVVISPSGEAGSIGVYAVHRDISSALQAAGVNDTIVKAGRFKAEGAPSEPLTLAAREAIQAVVDEFYGRFTGHVAEARGTTRALVQSGYGEGRLLTAKQAVASGLADRVASFSAVLQDLGVETPSMDLGQRRSSALHSARLRRAERALAVSKISWR